ncbi:hypothetical protein [Rhodopirellula sp. SWK7]|uniref:hypothetical protein n=1 Tax=Rhodopirellula sp. SWK7 TaxID=595460 RepID=UPI001181BDFD|nr:hypothetical protein [Rhodopirellula sp. SWK7]
MRTLINIGFLTLCLNIFVGCGSKQGSLATEHGTMTIEEYEKLSAQSQAGDDGEKESDAQ